MVAAFFRSKSEWTDLLRRHFVPVLDRMPSPQTRFAGGVSSDNQCPGFSSTCDPTGCVDCNLRRGVVARFKRHARRFSPVERAGVSYVDGGVVNDLPVDIARQIGADYVIAISWRRNWPHWPDHGDLYLKPSERLPGLFNFSA